MREHAGDFALRSGVAVTALTAAWVAWHHQSTVHSWLFMGRGTSEAFAANVERVAAGLLVISALSLLRKPSLLACSVISLWMLALAVTTWLQGGESFAALAPASHAVRFVAPLSLYALHRGRPELGFGWLRAAIAITFLAHGYEALQHHPQFIDLLIPGLRRHLGWEVSEAQARTLLTFIGVTDWAVALALLLRRWKWVAIYMAAWGAITLTSRTLAWGWERWPEAGVRWLNFSAPLALALYWRVTANHGSHESRSLPSTSLSETAP